MSDPLGLGDLHRRGAMLVILRLLKVSPWPVSGSETAPSEPRRDSPLGWGKWCAISRRASVFLPSPCASLSRCGEPQLPDALGWAGTAPGVFTAWHRRFQSPGIAKPGFPALCDSGSPVRAPGVCLWPGLLTPATTRLGRWNGLLWAP